MFFFSFAFFCQNRFKNTKKKIASVADAVHCHNKKARTKTATQVEKRKAVEETVDELYNWINAT